MANVLNTSQEVEICQNHGFSYILWFYRLVLVQTLNALARPVPAIPKTAQRDLARLRNQRNIHRDARQHFICKEARDAEGVY